MVYAGFHNTFMKSSFFCPSHQRLALLHSAETARVQSRASHFGAGWSSPVARQAHNLKVVGSNPTPATKCPASANRPKIPTISIRPIASRRLRRALCHRVRTHRTGGTVGRSAYIVRREGRYLFRTRWPRCLMPILGSASIRIALGTAAYPVALRRPTGALDQTPERWRHHRDSRR